MIKQKQVNDIVFYLDYHTQVVNECKITSIKNNIGDEITYTYDNSNLSGIYYNKKLYQSYSYDNGGYLVNISKSDGACVKIDYDYVAWLGKRCIKVSHNIEC